MLTFDRSKVPPPSVFTSKEASQYRRLLREYFSKSSEQISQTRVSRKLLSLDEPSTHRALNHLFHGKCAFCEASTKVQPYRFRPAAEATPPTSGENAHLYYTWLADAWDNIYPICVSCVPKEPFFFPVKGRRARIPDEADIDQFVKQGNGLWLKYPPSEKPLLLDPCALKDFAPLLHVQLDGRMEGLTESGSITIENYNLNAEKRVKQRRLIYEKRLDELIRNCGPGEKTAKTWRQVIPLFEFERLEFGGTWYLLLRRLALEIGSHGSSHLVLSKARIRRFYHRLWESEGAVEKLEQARATLIRDDKVGLKVKIAVPKPRQGRARLISVEIKNFKALEDLSFQLPPADQGQAQLDNPSQIATPSLLILGENAAGKSSILEAIALAMSHDAARTELALDPKSFILRPEFMGGSEQDRRESATVSLKFDDGSSHVLSIGQKGFVDSRHTKGFEMPGVFAYGAFRQYLTKQRSYSPAKYVKNLLRSDVVLSNPEKWLLSLNPPTFSMVVRALRDVLSIEGDFDVIWRNPERTKCHIVTSIMSSDIEEKWGKTPLDVASSGFRTVLATICDIFQGLMDPRVNQDFESLSTARAVVLIDEVEAHLHPRWKMNIMRGLRNALPNVTFIATTHDPLCLRAMADNEVLVLQRAASKQPPQTARKSKRAPMLPMKVERLEHLPATSNLTIEQLLTSDFFQLFSADAPEIDRQFAGIAALLAAQRLEPITDPEKIQLLRTFESSIASVLPIGTSEGQRLVQEVVAEFLKERRTASDETLQRMRNESKARIMSLLRGINHAQSRPLDRESP
ncbi:AAA family ATPase [Pseudomonas baetica]|uniref:AAA family ATPase n=1 Tax=Pseudomonas baetica TaxID=674054 RepID=UPI003EF02923